MSTFVTVLRIVCVVLAFYTGGESVWRAINSPRLHQRMMMTALTLFSVGVIVSMATSMHDSFDVRLLLVLAALVCMVIGHVAWRRLDKVSPNGVFGSRGIDSASEKT